MAFTTDELNAALESFSRRLILKQGCTVTARDDCAEAARRVFDRLRLHFSKVMGETGFQVLLSRALSCAVAKHPHLSVLAVRDGGALEGFRELDSGERISDAAVILLSQLLTLLCAFIGESLAMQLVRDIWPEVTLSTNPKQKE